MPVQLDDIVLKLKYLCIQFQPTRTCTRLDTANIENKKQDKIRAVLSGYTSAGTG